MKIKFKELVKWSFIFISLIYLMGCSHTVQGMKQDVHEATASDQKKPVHVKKVTVVTTPESLPSSPPPLEVPASQ